MWEPVMRDSKNDDGIGLLALESRAAMSVDIESVCAVDNGCERCEAHGASCESYKRIIVNEPDYAAGYGLLAPKYGFLLEESFYSELANTGEREVNDQFQSLDAWLRSYVGSDG